MSTGIGIGIGIGPFVNKSPSIILQSYSPGDADLSTTRASDAVYVDSTGDLQEMASNVAADAHYEQGERTVLLEGASTNLMPDFDSTKAAFTTKTAGVTEISGGWTARGFTNGVQFPDSTGSPTTNYVLESISLTGGQIYTFSALVEMDDGSVPRLGTSTADGSADVVLFIDANAATTNPKVVRVAGNLYRVNASYTPVTSRTQSAGVYNSSSNSNKPFKVNGFQLVAGAVPGPLVWTSGGSGSRSADAASITLDAGLRYDRYFDVATDTPEIALYDRLTTESGGSHVPTNGRAYTHIGIVPTGTTLQTARSAFGVTESRPQFGQGVWTWFNYPMAVRYSGTYDRTYFGSIDSAGDVQVHSFDHDTGEIVGPVTLSSALDVDDHCNPAIVVRPDGKLLAVYSVHNGECYYRISTNAEDISAWGAETQIGALTTRSYAQIHYLSNEDKFHLFFRESTGTGDFEREISSDDGVTWGSATHVIDNSTERPYVRSATDGVSKIHFAFTDGHPDSVTNNSIYHVYYEGGNWYETDGTLIGADGDLPLTPADATKIYDSVASGKKAWIWDCRLDDSGNPVVVFAVFESTTDHRYYYSKWTGSAWSTPVEVCTAGSHLYSGEPYYSGGIAIENVNSLIASRQVNGVHELFRYTTSDGGSTWSGSAMTSGSAYGHIRPVVPLNAAATLPTLSCVGRYTTFENYATHVESHGA